MVELLEDRDAWYDEPEALSLVSNVWKQEERTRRHESVLAVPRETLFRERRRAFGASTKAKLRKAHASDIDCDVAGGCDSNAIHGGSVGEILSILIRKRPTLILWVSSLLFFGGAAFLFHQILSFYFFGILSIPKIVASFLLFLGGFGFFSLWRQVRTG